METYVCVKNQTRLLHKYPEAKDDVSFLRYEHRHVFHVITCLSVKHNDRDVEFFALKKEVQSILRCFKQLENGTSFSCEDLCGFIVLKLSDNAAHGREKRKITVKVSEDNENFVVMHDEYTGLVVETSN
jgi:hypothetical protein